MGESIKNNFAWQRWKLGVIVACISGVATGIISVEAFVDKLNWLVLVKAAMVILACTAKDFLLYTKQHDVEKVLDEPINSGNSLS